MLNAKNVKQRIAKETKEVQGKTPDKIWKTNRGEQDPYGAFNEYVAHRPIGENVPEKFSSFHWRSQLQAVGIKVPVVRNTLAKMMQKIASMAALDGKFTNSSGRKTVVQSLRDEFHSLEISELTCRPKLNSRLQPQPC